DEQMRAILLRAGKLFRRCRNLQKSRGECRPLQIKARASIHDGGAMSNKSFRSLSVFEKGLLSLAACLLLGLTASAEAQSADHDALGGLTARFLAAYEKKSLGEILSIWSAVPAGRDAARQEFEKRFAADEKIELRNLTFRKVAIEGGKAVVRVSLEMKA